MSKSVEKVDLRSEPMPRRDGVGLAADRRASALERLGRLALLPTEVPARRVALETTQGLLGFWVLWQLEGGFEGLKRLGFSDATIYRKIKSFRESFGEHPDLYQFPGLVADPEGYLRVFGPLEGERGPGDAPGAG